MRHKPSVFTCSNINAPRYAGFRPGLGFAIYDVIVTHPPGCSWFQAGLGQVELWLRLGWACVFQRMHITNTQTHTKRNIKYVNTKTAPNTSKLATDERVRTADCRAVLIFFPLIIQKFFTWSVLASCLRCNNIANVSFCKVKQQH